MSVDLQYGSLALTFSWIIFTPGHPSQMVCKPLATQQVVFSPGQTYRPVKRNHSSQGNL